jgi:hypothetical protein
MEVKMKRIPLLPLFGLSLAATSIHRATAINSTLSSVNVWKFIVSNHGTDAYQESAKVDIAGGTP